MKSKLIVPVIFIVCSALVGFYLYKKYRVAPTIDLLKQEVYNENNERVDLQKFVGKRLIISYYASWCRDCLQEMKTMNAVKATKYADAEVIAITDETQEKLVQFKNSRNYPFTFLPLNKGFDEIKIYSIPVTYIVNEEGKLIYEKVGAIDWESESFYAFYKGLK